MTTASATDIANMALTQVGAEGTLASLNDSTPEGRLCKIWYDRCRQAILRMHPWNFAVGRIILSPNSKVPAWGDLLAYPLPADCLRVLTTDDADKIYKVEGNQVITDEATLNLKYIKDVTDTTQFDALFVVCLSTYIAAKIAFKLTQSDDRQKSLLDEFSKVLPRARHVDATEDYPSSIIADEFVNVRIGPNRGWVRDPQT